MSDLEVPWAIHHSEHSARLARVMTQLVAGDGSGVSRPADLRVRPLNVPGNGFRVAPGGGTAQSRDTDASARESYTPLLGRELTVTDVPGTGSGETRRDLVILEITDPAMQSVTYPAPTDPEYTGGWLDGDNFNRITVIPNVGASVTSLDQITTGYYAHVTGITLAAINWPKSTGTITAAMIEDLRELQNPRRSEVVFARPRVAADDSPQNYLTASVTTGGEYFPGGGGYENEFTVDVPEWATRMVIDARWMAVNYGLDRRPIGRFWIEYGNEFRNKTWPKNGHYEFRTQEFRFNASRNAAGSTTDWSLMDEVPVPSKLRGKQCTFVFKAGVQNVPGANHTWMDSLSGLGCRVTFAERAVDAHML